MDVSSMRQTLAHGQFCGYFILCVCVCAILVTFQYRIQLAELPTCRCKPARGALMKPEEMAAWLV